MKRLNCLDGLLSWWFSSLYALVLIAIAAAFLSDDKPGSYAPLVAFFTAVIALSRSAGLGSHHVLARVFIAIGSLGTAYLWLVGEEGADILSPALPQTLLVLVLLALANTVLVPVLYGVIYCIRRNREQHKNDQNP